ncbi:uncharacterized protein EV420DRAFT_541437 [Desarmillaria tabescens]|uniref:Uncharacterized protein n=1 Tax=Armillaria tabescens TaxID=1929756 RepID=A0AA39K9L9_ARMTA|nr:uncharacterized protein EV420DRAFT_541437 [Desarmillaria tabescens]KAK0457131.1 hypothetical protein EV420DRAFT_541437 [Desarmillaria tabescens]
MHDGCIFLFGHTALLRPLLQDRVLSNLSSLDMGPWTSTCASECMDTANAAEIIHSHLQHVHFIMDLLEGAGLKENRRVVLNARIFDYVTRDAERRALLDDLTAFSDLRKDVEREYEKFLSADFAVGVEFIIRDFKYAIDDLNATVGYEQDASTIFPMPNRHVMVDDALRRSLDHFVRHLEFRFMLLAKFGIPSLLDVISQVHSHGQRISEELQAEIPRVQEAYENIPWWQSVAPIEMLGEGTQRRVFTSYHEFLSAKAVDIREQVEHAEIVYDHFAVLQGYFTWYTNGLPSVSRVVVKRTAGRVLTVARLLEVMEDLEYRMSSIRTAKEPVHRFTCPHLQLP